jgi:hypothetical protein
MHPDYETLRGEAPFAWYVGSGYPALLGLVGDITLKDTNSSPDAMIDLYRKGMPLFEEAFDSRVRRPALSTASVSYAHVNGLGVELIFPEYGEVNYENTGWSLDRYIAILQEKPDFASKGMMPFFLDYWKKMQAAFPGEKIGLGLGYEGPMTTAYELRDMDVFTDVYDKPEKFKQFMSLLVQSIVDFAHFRAALEGRPTVNSEAGHMCDDVASMFSPEMWPQMVLPYIHGYYDGLTTGSRSAHIEDLRPEHLPFLEDIGLIYFDPSISAEINPTDIAARCRVPFGWRLGSFHYATMSSNDIRDWIFQAVADGATKVFSHVAEIMINPVTIRKVHDFMDHASEVEELIKKGMSREDIGKEVSSAGRNRFWGTWPD